ncbi:unnamed protein product [Chrysoparadoxa australica]
MRVVQRLIVLGGLLSAGQAFVSAPPCSCGSGQRRKPEQATSRDLIVMGESGSGSSMGTHWRQRLLKGAVGFAVLTGFHTSHTLTKLTSRADHLLPLPLFSFSFIKLGTCGPCTFTTTGGLPVIGGALRAVAPESVVVKGMGPEAAEAAALKKYSKRTVKEKLANIPCFMIVNSGGQPFLTPSGTGEQQGVFFLSYADADQMLSEMLQIPGYAGDAKLYILSLDKAYDMVKAPPRGTGYLNDDGKEEVMMFRFHESVQSRDAFLEYGKLSDVEDVAVPVFYAEGMTLRRDGTDVRPLFLEAKDLVDTWFAAARKDPSMSKTPTIKVYDLFEVVLQMEDGRGDFKEYGFFPGKAAMEFIQETR